MLVRRFHSTFASQAHNRPANPAKFDTLPCQHVKSTLSPFYAHPSSEPNITIVWYMLYRGLYVALTSAWLVFFV
jgi:hypothetical protein